MKNLMLSVLLMCVGNISCARSGDELSSWSGSITDSAGIAMVTNPETGAWGEASPWRIQEELRIGSTGGDPNYQFGQIVGIATGGVGQIFVLDQQAAQVRVFDSTGTFERTFGKPGGGPGEIHPQGATALLHGPADTMFVVDMRNGKVLRFLEDGSEAGSYRLDFTSGIPVRWDVMSDGSVVSQLRKFAPPNQPVADTMDVIVSRNTDGSIRDTIMSMPAGKTFTSRGGAPEFHFFSAEPIWALARPSGVWFGVNDTYRIRLYDAEGELSRIITKPFERSAITEDDEEVVTQTVERLWGEAGLPPQAVARLKSAINFAEFFPAYLQILSGPAGTLWVQHLRVPRDLDDEEKKNFNPLLSMGAPDWDIFDAQGRFLGVLSLPDRFQPLRFAENRVYGVWRDDLDVQYVLALRIMGGNGDTGLIQIGGGN